jgi:hypothetical protein
LIYHFRAWDPSMAATWEHSMAGHAGTSRAVQVRYLATRLMPKESMYKQWTGLTRG